ncbi:hypothetical protein SAMN04489740_0842 [Arthrobacter alpinus]|uniref:Uncharacterized protein n=2 Tax=Arthrobacter alpinus TaxID=656366 RepID=A0A1H5GT01_9MICC|nr:hypothetical protein SAMN04489740_0842 [Arthrobacter alpinus]
MAAVSSGLRLWNPFARAMIQAEFRGRIALATQGELKPIEQVKDVGGTPVVEPLYEIRWQEIAVTDAATSSTPKSHYEVMVRLYHSEPSEEPEYFIGHHAHEKVIDGSETWNLQTAEIQVAAGYYRLGEGVNWGIVHACSNP